jgi:hypothetical protein
MGLTAYVEFKLIMRSGSIIILSYVGFYAR